MADEVPITRTAMAEAVEVGAAMRAKKLAFQATMHSLNQTEAAAEETGVN